MLKVLGNTPLVRMRNIEKKLGLKCQLLAKCEYLSPGGSIKDRIGIQMIEIAERQGVLKPGMTIIEPTAGNTGIGLGIAAAIKGYKLICCIPVKMSAMKIQMIESLGGKVVRTPLVEESHPDSHMNTALRLSKEIPNSWMPDQYCHIGNPLAHYLHTANEIIE